MVQVGDFKCAFYVDVLEVANAGRVGPGRAPFQVISIDRAATFIGCTIPCICAPQQRPSVQKSMKQYNQFPIVALPFLP